MFIKGDKVKSIIPKNASYGIVGTFIKYKEINGFEMALVKYDEMIGIRDVLTHDPRNLKLVKGASTNQPNQRYTQENKSSQASHETVLGVIWENGFYYDSLTSDKESVIDWAKTRVRVLKDIHGESIDVRFTLTKPPRKVTVKETLTEV